MKLLVKTAPVKVLSSAAAWVKRLADTLAPLNFARRRSTPMKSVWVIVAPEKSAAPDSPIQHRARQLGRGQPHRLHPRLGQVGGRKIRARHLGAVEHGAGEIALGHLCLGQVGQIEIRADGGNAGQDCAAQVGTVEGGVRQVRTRQINPGQVGLLEVRAMQVAAPALLYRSGNQIGDLIRKDRAGYQDQGRRHHDAHSWSLLLSKGPARCVFI